VGKKMISETKICNLALTKLGTNTIVNLTESTENARRCNLIYDPIRREILRAHTWCWATKIQTLSEIADEEIINYDYIYTYPADCLYILRVFDENETDINNYKILLTTDTNKRCIATNTYQAYIEYIKDIDDVTLFDDIFIEAFAARIAAELVMPLTGNENLKGSLLQEYQIQIEKAKKTNQQEKHTVLNQSSPYLAAR
jgi:hypothetical protein